MATTAELPWLHDWITCTNPCHCRTPSTRRYTTDMCQDIPRLPNQSACDSRYLCGKNFIAQSFTMKTVSWSRASMTSRRAWSWCADRNKWHFHDWMASVAWLVRYTASSLSSSVWNGALATASEMAASVEFRLSHCLHASSCLWSHCCRRSGLVQSLRANTLQWLATSELVLMWTCQETHLNALHVIPVLPRSLH